MNSHDCTIISQMFEFLNPHRQGEAVKPLVDTMIRRSQMFSMENRTVLIIGTGGFNKRFISDSYKSFGINVSHLPTCTFYSSKACSLFTSSNPMHENIYKINAISFSNVSVLIDRSQKLYECKLVHQVSNLTIALRCCLNRQTLTDSGNLHHCIIYRVVSISCCLVDFTQKSIKI